MGVVGAGAGRLAGSLGPVQNAGLGVVAIGGGLAQGVRDAGDLVPVSRIYRAGGNGLAAAAQLYGLDVAIGIIGEPGGNALRAYRFGHVVVTIISIRLTGPTWQGHFYQIVVGIVIIFGFVLLQVYHADEIAVGVVVIAMSKLLFEQLHIVEIDGVQCLDIGRVDAHLGVGLGCFDHAGNKLPTALAVCIRIELDKVVACGAICVIESHHQGIHPAIAVVRIYAVALGPAGHRIYIACGPAKAAQNLIAILVLVGVTGKAHNPLVRVLRGRAGIGDDLVRTGAAGVGSPGGIKGKVAVFHQVIPAGRGGLFQLQGVKIGGRTGGVLQEGKNRGIGASGWQRIRHLQPGPGVIGRCGGADDQGLRAAGLQQSNAGSAGSGSDIGGEGICLPGLKGPHSAADRLEGVVLNGQGGAAIIGLGLAVAPAAATGAGYRPSGLALEAAAFQQIDDGILQLGRQRQLTGLGQVRAVGILGELRTAQSILHRQGTAVAVELHDLLVAVVIGKCGLVMCIFQRQCSACGAAIVFLDGRDSVRLSVRGRVIGIRQLIAVSILRTGQQMFCTIGKCRIFPVWISDGPQIIAADLVGHSGQLCCAGTCKADLGQVAAAVIAESVFAANAIRDDRDVILRCVVNGDTAGCGLVIGESSEPSTGIEIAFAAALFCDTEFFRSAAGIRQLTCRLQFIHIQPGRLFHKIVAGAVLIFPPVVGSAA